MDSRPCKRNGTVWARCILKSSTSEAHAIDIRVDVDPVHWFLNEKEDTRSSYYLEDAATEFQVQGLEVDWACVTWDGDLRFTGSGWSFHDFRGYRWCNIANPDNRRYLRTPTESCSPVLGKEWLFLSRLVTQLIRLGGLSFTIQLSTILSRLASRN